MRTESEVVSRMETLRKQYDETQDERLKPLIAILKWIISGKKDTNRENELFEIYHSKLKGRERLTFNALRRYEAKIDRPVRLDEIKEKGFISRPLLSGFGQLSRELVLANPTNYLF